MEVSKHIYLNWYKIKYLLLKYDWDATAYDHISYIQESWGHDIIKYRKCKGNEIVLDAGCGSARLTKILSIK